MHIDANRTPEKSRDTLYALPSGEIVGPGCSEHEALELMSGMSLSDQRRFLHLMQMVVAGEFDILQTLEWSDERKREFVRSLPE
ncbi:hypothetical protein [Luteimonas sp. YGD11-2]|uniref:hypothetical protein n=1 Tax=Luteimonas sp. YGD11-2 TaxID=2508168 RepID=UPI00100BC229|nr:hypothetical protein [Luteimonas sp. YGD11-2]